MELSVSRVYGARDNVMYIKQHIIAVMTDDLKVEILYILFLYIIKYILINFVCKNIQFYAILISF